MKLNRYAGEITNEEAREIAEALRSVYGATKDDIAVYAPPARPGVRYVEKIRFFGDDVYLTGDQVRRLVASFLKERTRETADFILRRPNWDRDRSLQFAVLAREAGAYAVFREEYATCAANKQIIWLLNVTYRDVVIVPSNEEAAKLAQAPDRDTIIGVLDAARERTVRQRQGWEADLDRMARRSR